MKIGRTLFWFKDGDKTLHELTTEFFGLTTMLNRLINEDYEGKKIKFINIYYSNEKAYELYPKRLREEVDYRGVNLYYYTIVDYEKFNKLTKSKQALFLWNSAYECLTKASLKIGNEALLTSCEYAYNKGLQIKLNTDFRVLTEQVILFKKELVASIWIHFGENRMYSKFLLEKNDEILFSQDIDSAKNGIEFFLEIYKGIEVTNNYVIVKGAYDVEYLPLKIEIEESCLLLN